MKQNYKLILLNDGRNILVSDEKINHRDKVFSLKTNDWFVRNIDDELECNNVYFKIIAGIESLLKLTYSDEVKQILRDKYGWVDATEEGHKIWKSLNRTALSKTDELLFVNGVEHAFKVHQSITNKMFSLEDVKKAFFNGGDMKDIEEFNFFIQSLQQPIHLKVEIEMEVVRDFDNQGTGEIFHTNFKLEPKIENNSILITKILN